VQREGAASSLTIFDEPPRSLYVPTVVDLVDGIWYRRNIRGGVRKSGKRTSVFSPDIHDRLTARVTATLDLYRGLQLSGGLLWRVLQTF
jgi:hypothetical protein